MRKVRNFLFLLLFIGLGFFLVKRYHAVVAAGPLNWHDRLIVRMVGPPDRGLNFIGRWIGDGVRHYLFLAGVSKENDRLRGKIEELQVRQTLAADITRENERLRGMIDLKSTRTGEWIVARVIAFPPLGEFRLLTLDKGSEAGIRRRAPVLALGGLVGQITHVGKGFSQVLLITDPTSVVDGHVVRTGARGLIVGKARHLDFQHDLFLGAFEFLNRTSELAQGDLVETTGLDGIFPAGLAIGTVEEVNRKKYDVFLGAEVIPAVDFNKLQEVSIFQTP